MQLQGETSVRTDSEKAFRIQSAAGDTLLAADTTNGQLSVNGSVTISIDSAAALDIQNANGDSFLTADTATNTLTVAGDSVFQGNITVSGHVITAGEAPNAAIQAAAGAGATCVVTGNDSSGTITITAGSDSLSEGDTCVLTFSKPYTGTPRPLVSPLNKSSAEAGPYASADSNTLTLSFAQAPVAGQTYSFNYWNVQ